MWLVGMACPTFTGQHPHEEHGLQIYRFLGQKAQPTFSAAGECLNVDLQANVSGRRSIHMTPMFPGIKCQKITARAGYV